MIRLDKGVALTLAAGLVLGVQRDTLAQEAEAHPQTDSASELQFVPAEAPSSAGDPWAKTLVTDRPDRTEAAQTVGQWSFQVEFGVAVESDRAAGVRTTAIRTPTKVRFGVLERLELHLETDAFATDRFDGGPDDGKARWGFNDVALGFKAHLVQEGYWGGAGPAVAILASVTMPAGTKGFSGGIYVPRLIVALGWSLPAELALGINLGVEIPETDTGRRYAQGFWSLSLGRSLAPASERVGVFVEAFGALPFSSPAETWLALDGGFTFLLTPDVQLDIYGGGGVTADAPSVLGGMGLSFRM
jgi:hypothetical protein